MIKSVKELLQMALDDVSVVELEGIVCIIRCERFGYRVTVVHATDLYPMVQDGESAVISKTYINDVLRYGYDFRNMCAYYNGYNSRITVHELSLFDIVLEGLLND